VQDTGRIRLIGNDEARVRIDKELCNKTVITTPGTFDR
jgi:hypothetical protein